MQISKIPPYIVLNISKEVIFYISQKNNEFHKINSWLKDLNLSNYNGMVIKSKCIFNNLQNQSCF